VTTRVVCDASALVALLLDSGPDGRWVTEALTAAELAAPSLVAFEAANIIRRHELAGLIGTDQAVQAHADLLDLTIEHWPYEVLAARA
jgi:predicted nucleic acid-binding protein